MATLAVNIEANVPGECPFCGEAFADPEDVNSELGIHDPDVNENQVYRRHRRQHVWDDLSVPDPEDDIFLKAFFADNYRSYHDSESTSDTDDSERTDDEIDEDSNDPRNTYTVEFNYTAVLNVEVLAQSEAEAKRNAKDKKFEEDLEPQVTDLVHTRVSNW